MSSQSYLQRVNGKITGAVRTYGQHFAFWLEPSPRVMSDKSPTHEIWAKDSLGSVKIGVAWERELKRGEYIGVPMYSLIVDDPMFEQALTFSAFPADAHGNYDINFERKRQDRQAGGSKSTLQPPAEAVAA